MYFVQNNKEIHLSFKNSETKRTQALAIPYRSRNNCPLVNVGNCAYI